MNRKRGLGALIAVALGVTAAVAVSSATARSGSPASAASAGTALVKCGNTMSIGFLYPKTGPAASLGKPQGDWANWYIRTKKGGRKYRLVQEDTQLGGPQSPAEAVKGAQALTGSANLLGVAGPAGSQEVVATTPIFKGAGLGFVSGSATRTTLTDGSRAGNFFRTVPPDAQQSTDVSNYMTSKLNVKSAYIIDEQNAYSTGLADEVQAKLKAKGVDVTRESVNNQTQPDYSSLIAKIPSSTGVVYLPWQLPPRAQAFGRQMKQAGKGSVKLFGSDGLFDPLFSGLGSNVYDSFFPIDPKAPQLKAFMKAHGGNNEAFGIPTYGAVQVVATAIDNACKNGTASRAEVRNQIGKMNIKTSILGIPLSFTKNGDVKRRKFPIYHSVNGKFVRVT
jgi:branched-chain amino acid transport system substrate-binding protein